jgi:hypothetical protein
LIGRKNVHDHVAKVEQNPRAVGISLDAPDRQALSFTALDDRIGDGACLNFRTTGDQGKGVGKNRASGDVDGDKILALLF